MKRNFTEYYFLMNIIQWNKYAVYRLMIMATFLEYIYITGNKSILIKKKRNVLQSVHIMEGLITLNRKHNAAT